jgi:hypothetical protein
MSEDAVQRSRYTFQEVVNDVCSTKEEKYKCPFMTTGVVTVETYLKLCWE